MMLEHPDFYVPNLYTFQNGNAYLGSFHGLRFRLAPVATTESPKVLSHITTQVWYGDYCLELSHVEDESRFPLSEEGYDDMLRWLERQYQIFQEKEQ